ncbi:MAG TPA: hypothetical protein PKC59_04625 [Burkholderiaceae bacterium]|nr:hypothetical protein [Burkholderiaceae bacterium]HMY99178.1 hypothetical protein [Burkholderiaceae bacterium]HNB42727.1 hypothetical protein [Burkholderiaceae bacterium]HNG79779.1 hypothetical protein [Burkholderiaceae bacterium]
MSSRPDKYKWPIIYGWTAVAALPLVNQLLGRPSAVGGGELAYQMFIICFPSSIGTGFILNAIDTRPILAALPGPLALLFIWLPYAALGLLQWTALALVIEWTRNRKAP